MIAYLESIIKTVLCSIVLISIFHINICEAESSQSSNPTTSRQAQLKSIASDSKISSADRGWLKQEMNSIERGQRKTMRVPRGKELAHHRGFEAKKGFDYSHSSLNESGLHKLQHKHDNHGKKNSYMWSRKGWGL